MLLKGANRQRKFETVYIEDLVPEEHILRKIDKYIDFSFINDLCRPYYVEKLLPRHAAKQFTELFYAEQSTGMLPPHTLVEVFSHL